jgi:organic radical activating enzyme
MDLDKLIKSKYFCVLPFVRQTILYDGDYRICCYSGTEHLEYAEDNVRAFNTDQLKQIRQSLLREEFPNICRDCKKLADVGLTSPAQIETEHWVEGPPMREKLMSVINDFTAGIDILPTWLDVRYSNVCNLKCRTCNGANSSAIQAEYNKISKFYTDDKIGYHPIKQVQDHKFPTVDKQLFGIYFAGGEPFLDENILNFLETWPDPSTSIVISSNLTIINEKLINSLTRFENITIMASIDAHGALNDYIRNGSKFNQLIDNIEQLSAIPNVQVSIHSVLNMINIFDMDKLVVYLKDRFPNLVHKIASVANEEHLYVNCLPYELRNQALESLDRIIQLANNHTFASGSEIKLNVEAAIYNLTQQNFNADGFDRFIKYSQMFDKLRDENLSIVVPQYAPYYNVQNNTSS